ncbi:hypothetical protein CVT25_009865, partial [Psilocybe cyanescens]
KTSPNREVHYLQSQNGNLFSSNSFDSDEKDSSVSEFAPLLPDVPKEIPWCSEALGQHPDAVNIWIGDEQSVTSIHSDPYENLYTVIRGEKHFFLLPPSDSWCLKEHYYPHATYARSSFSGDLELFPSMQSTPPVRWSSILDPESPNALPKQVTPIKVTLRAGDSLYLPVGWWHYVRQSGLTIALNWWYDAEMRGMSWVLLNFLRNSTTIDSQSGENNSVAPKRNVFGPVLLNSGRSTLLIYLFSTMAKDKSEKKRKEAPVSENEDVDMGNATVEKSPKKAKKDKEEIIVSTEDLSPIAHPLAQKKLVKKLHKTIKKASKARQVKRGVKEVVKGIRKGEKGLLILAADINPIDIISHLPVLSEEAQIPYIFVSSKEELGHASSTKRPTSCVMIFSTYPLLRPIMPAPKSKTASNANGAPKGKTASTSGTATPVSTTTADKDTLEQLASYAGGRPDKKVYDAEQAKIKSEIDALQAKLVVVRDKISLATKSGSGNDRRNALRSELDSIRDVQSANKNSKGKFQEQVDALQAGIQKKIKDLQASKSKIPFKNVAEVDAHIKNLEKQVESGNMKLADEKRALQEISTSKRNRRAVEGFQADQESIETDRAKIEELRKEMHNPAADAISERYAAIRAELDVLKKEGDEAYAGRSKLFEERDGIQNQLKVLFDAKRESISNYREANDLYWTKVNEDRARRAEKARVQRAAEEAQKKQEYAERLLEEAQAPAFQAQIEDCQTLIDYFSGKSTVVAYKSTGLATRAEVTAVPKLELRKVEDVPEGLVARKKKSDEDNTYFVATKNKGKYSKNTKPSAKANGSAPSGETTPTAPTNTSLHVPLPTLSALLSLSIPPPASTTDVPRLIEDLNTKKAWFEANQDRVTAENVAKANAAIQRLTKGEIPSTDDVTPPNGGGENPAEPTPTPQAGPASDPVSSEAVVDQLEVVAETVES